MNYFDFQPEDLPEMPRYELRNWRELVRFMKDVYGKVFTDPPRRTELPKEFLERYFRFRWHRQPRTQQSELNQP
jgi:hypothetical protein